MTSEDFVLYSMGCVLAALAVFVWAVVIYVIIDKLVEIYKDYFQ